MLDSGTIDVWRANLEQAGDDVRGLLCTEERARAERMARPRDGVLWARSRGVLRALLGRYLQVDGATLCFTTGPQGKPALGGEPSAVGGAPRWLCFNLSHSGAVALYAFARNASVGVDVELGRRDTDAVAVARRLFGAADTSRLEALNDHARQREFLRLWVRYEAALKYAGSGIHGAAPAGDGTPQPWICELALGDNDGDGAAAVAAESQPRELRRWGWATA